MAAPAPSTGGDPKKDLFFFLALLIGLMFLWYALGGRNSPGAKGGPFLQPPVGGQTSSIGSKNTNAPNKIYLSAPYGGRQNSSGQEYLKIEAPPSNGGRVNITGWRIQNNRGESVIIGQGVTLPRLYQQNYFENIYLAPGEVAYVTTGLSPVGASFKTNKCSGYFDQAGGFSPALSKDCPNPAGGEAIPSYVNNQCLDFLRSVSRCQTSFSYPSNLSGNCQNFISENLNYNGCVNSHKDDSDFYQSEWRLYLGRSSTMWSYSGNTILLKDASGKLIDSVSL